MDIGQLNRRAELINCGRTLTPAGGWTRADSVEMTVWANLKPASWSQQQRAERLEQRITHVLTIRWRRDLAAGFGPEARVRIRDAGGRTREFSIQTVVDPDDKRTWLEIGCLEGGPL